MDVDPEQLTAAVLRLPDPDRARLAARLLASLEGPEAEQAAYDAAWEAEFDRREAAADADPTRERPAAESLARIRAGLAANRVARAEETRGRAVRA